MNRLIITDRNYRTHVQQCQDRGLRTGCQPALPSERKGTPFAEKIDIIPASKRKALIKARANSRLSDLIVDAKLPCYDQGGTNYCWAHAGTLAVNATAIAAGQAMVELAPESVAVPVTGGRNRGGTLTEALDQLVEYGVAERQYIPKNGFKQSRFDDGWIANRKLHRIHEYYPVTGPNIWDQIATGLVAGGFAFMVGLDWWGHAVTYLDLNLDDDGEEIVDFRNSWDKDYGDNGFASLSRDRGTPVDYWGIYAVRTVIVPGEVQ